MLSSGSVVSPTNQATETIATQSAIDNSELTNNDLTSAVEEQVETATKASVEDSSSLETTSKVATEDTAASAIETAAKSQDQKDTQTFGDNPGHLPDDAIKSDDKNPKNDQSSSQISEESSLTQKQAASEAATTATETATIDSDKKMDEIPEQSSDMKTEENREPDQSIVNTASENQQQTTQEDNNNSNNVQSFEAQEQPKQDESSESTTTTETSLSKSSDFSEEEPKQKKTQKGKKKHKGHSNNNNDNNKDAQKSMLPKEETKKPWSSQADQAQKEKEGQVHTWNLCNVTAGADYIPCLDNELAISKLTSRRHFEHRERHCPQEPSTCLVPLPNGYKRSIEWPDSRDKVIDVYVFNLMILQNEKYL